MGLQRHFLSWDRPCLESAADWLIAHAAAGSAFSPAPSPAIPGAVELSDAAVVLPARRAARRLEELLLERAEACGGALSPPRLATVGALPELVAAPGAAIAEPLQRQLAWIAALREAPAEALERIAAEPPERDELSAWAALAERLETLHVELSGAALPFHDVAERGRELTGDLGFTEREAERWRALATVQQRYREMLAAQGLLEPHRARLEALERGATDPPRMLVLVGIAELNAMQRRAVEAAQEHAVALIHAPENEAEGFDAFGALRPAYWAERPVEIRDEELVMADRPPDQASAVIDAVARLGDARAADEITVGVCDERVTPHLAQQLPTAGLPVHNAAGEPVSRTRPLRLLRAVADWLESQRLGDLAALLRHTDVEALLATRAAPTTDSAEETEEAQTRPRDGAPEDWLTLLDQHHNETLQRHVTGDWPANPGTRARLEALHEAVRGMLEGLLEAPRPLPEWAQPIAALLARVYDRPLNRARRADRLLAEACERVRAVLDEAAAVPPSMAPRVSGAQALRLLARRVEAGEGIPPEPDGAAIEVLGPLELALDDAPILVLTGFNEGRFPSSTGVDPFLPDAARQRLGLRCNADRYGRDAYLLCAMRAARATSLLIAGRHTAEGDPLPPSRLLFATPQRAALPGRVRRFLTPPHAARPPLPAHWQPQPRSGFPVPPPPEPPEAPPTTLSVTAFKDHIACPYRFYLRHVLGLASLDDAAEELEAAAFGELAHAVLRDFAYSDAHDATDPERVADTLMALLDRHARHRLGAEPPPAVRVQLAQLRHRLRALAPWQAQRAAEGWRIAAAEQEVPRENPAPFPVDDEAFGLTGRIDRIDVHEERGAVEVFDYKTGDQGETPEKTHRKKASGERTWVDLQLPLYRHLLPKLGWRLESGAALRLGYILLPRRQPQTGPAYADWDTDALAAADEKARAVVRAIRGGDFWPPTERRLPYDEFAAICGVEQLPEETPEEEETVEEGS